MNSFLINLLKFSLLLFISILGLTFLSYFICNKLYDKKLKKKPSILLIGDSHLACGVNDAVFPEAVNISRGGSGYFYSYLKAKNFINANPKVDYLIVNYAYADVLKNRDKWYLDSDRIYTKIKYHFNLFSFKDYFNLVKANPRTLIYTPKVILYNLKTALKKDYKYVGSHNHVKGSVLDKAELPGTVNVVDTSYAKYETFYLKEIYNLCQEKHITLILLNTPVHPLHDKVYIKYKAISDRFAKEQLESAIIINHSNFQIDEKYFYDYGHLNGEGANIYTKFLVSEIKNLK